jgi:four helix bundle protein
MEPGTGNIEWGFRKLEAWRKADDLAAEIFRLTEKDVSQRHRWLSVQAVRAAFSITSNIAEGYGRSSLGDYIRFLEFAGASLNEVENALHFMRRNEVVPAKSLEYSEELRRATGNLLFGLLRSLRTKLNAKGDWQRGLLREVGPGYTVATEPDWSFGTPDLADGLDVPSSGFQVPSSKFPDAEVSHG